MVIRSVGGSHVILDNNNDSTNKNEVHKKVSDYLSPTPLIEVVFPLSNRKDWSLSFRSNFSKLNRSSNQKKDQGTMLRGDPVTKRYLFKGVHYLFFLAPFFQCDNDF